MADERGGASGVLLSLALAERSTRLGAIGAQNSKAGIYLGFSGIVIGLAAGLSPLWARLIVVLPGLVCAAFALNALLVRQVPGVSIKRARNRYLTSTADEAEVALVDLLASSQTATNRVLRRKSRAVTRSVVALSVAIAAMALVTVFVGPT